MQKDFELLHDQWKKHFFRHPEWEVYLMFPDYRGSRQVKPIKIDIKRAKKFEAQIIKLCRAFNFNLENPKRKISPARDSRGNHIYDLDGTGRLSYSVAELFVQMLVKNRKYVRELEADLVRTTARNKTVKRGPFKIPAFFAELVLIAIHLHRDSDAGTRLLRTFLEPRNELQQWLEKKASYPNPAKTFVYARGGSDINQWRSKLRQSFERIVLSSDLNREIKSFASCKRELEDLRIRVSKQTEKISLTNGRTETKVSRRSI